MIEKKEVITRGGLILLFLHSTGAKEKQNDKQNPIHNSFITEFKIKIVV